MGAATSRLLLAAAFCGAVFLSGCRHPMANYESKLVSGDYAGAASVATDEIKDGDGDELMWRLMAGGAYRLAGQGEETLRQLDRAEDAMIAHDTASVFAKGAKGAWAMVTNDKAFPYDGGGQDRIMTCLYKAIDFSVAGKTDAARTELNRAGQHQENWIYERRKEIAAAQERMRTDVEAYKRDKQKDATQAKSANIDSGRVVNGAFANATLAGQFKSQGDFDLGRSGVLDGLQPVDWMNPYVSHVTGVFRWLNGDAARNYLKDAATCRKDNPVAVGDFSACDKGGKPANQVWVWLEEGVCPKREEWRIDLPLILIPGLNRYVMYAGMAFPKLVYRESAGTGWAVGTSEGNVPMSEILDMDAKVKLEFDVYLREAIVREITRTTVKIGTQVALGVVAENVSDWRTRTALRASQLAAAAWAASTTGADTRSWTTLPKKVHVVRLTRPDDGKIRLVGSTGSIAEITVPAGNSMVFVSKPSAAAPASVKAVTYP